MDNSQHQPPIPQTPGDTSSQQDFMPTSMVEELPVEILQEIFLLIDCDTILPFLSTCRRFYDATSSGLLWYSIVDQIHAITGIRPEEELESYSIKELRGWCIRRLRARALWNSDSEIVTFAPRQELKDCCCKEKLMVHGVQLLPGGRWMICLTSYGKCCYVDLDSSEKSCQHLIRPRKRPEPEGYRFSFCIGIDHSRSRLTFRLAIIGSKARLIKIYRVVLKGHGQAAQLVAKHTSTLRGPSPGLTSPSAINKYYFIDHFIESDGHRVILRLFYHKDRVGIDEKMPYVSIPTGSYISKCLGFISTFCFVSHKFDEHASCLQICKIITCKDSNVPRRISVLHVIPVVGYPLTISPVCVFPNACRIVVFINGEVRGVSIPCDRPQDSKVTVLGRHSINLWSYCAYPPYIQVNLSSTTLIDPNKKQVREVLIYGWDNDGTNVKFQCKILSIPYQPIINDCMILLAEIGRIVKYDYFGNAFIVDSVQPNM